MRCPGCNAEVVPEAVYCHKCGERLDRRPAAQATDAGSLSNPFVSTPGELLQQWGAQSADLESEQELWRGGYSPKAMIGGWILSGIVSVAVLLIGLWWWPSHRAGWFGILAILVAPWLYHFALLVYWRVSIHYVLTTQRLVHEAGILRRVTNRIETIDMDDISVEQGLLERLVGVGTIRILSSDRTDPHCTLSGIENVKSVADLLDETRRAQRRRHGVHIEQI